MFCFHFLLQNCHFTFTYTSLRKQETKSKEDGRFEIKSKNKKLKENIFLKKMNR
jgi:hypothetical protein